MRMECTSARMTALYQIEQSSPRSTSPMTAAFSAMKTRAPNRGCFPSYSRTIMGREISTAPQPPGPRAPEDRPQHADGGGADSGEHWTEPIGSDSGEQAGDTHGQRDEAPVGGEHSAADEVGNFAL